MGKAVALATALPIDYKLYNYTFNPSSDKSSPVISTRVLDIFPLILISLKGRFIRRVKIILNHLLT